MRTSHAVKAILSLGTLSGALWAGTFATFTDTQDAVSTFTAGTVDLRLNSDATTSYSWTTLSLSNMKPTDTEYVPLTVANSGTLSFSYSMTSSATNTDAKGLASQLTFGFKLVASTGACDAAGYAAGTTVYAEGTLAAAAVSSRTLAAGASEVLCAHVLLPTGSGNAFQGATTTSTMTFAATQS